MKKLIIALVLLTSFNSNALTLEQFNVSHQQKQQRLFASLDYCTNIGSQEIFNLGTQNLQEIKKDLDVISSQFKRFKQQKNNCFDNSKNFLDSIIADNMIFLQTNETTVELELQNKIDQDLIETINLRRQINTDLLDSILLDIKKSIKHATAAEMKTDFITESTKTKRLISQELHIIYDSMTAQLKVDQQKLDLAEERKITRVANVSVRSAFLALNRSLLLFEDIEKDPRIYNVAKIKTSVEHAHNKLLELKAFSLSLEGLDSKEEVNQIINQLSILNVDLDVAVKTMTDGTFPENYLKWAGQIYQQISEIIGSLQKVLDTIYLIDMTQQPKPVDITKTSTEEIEVEEVETSLKPAKEIKVKE